MVVRTYLAVLTAIRQGQISYNCHMVTHVLVIIYGDLQQINNILQSAEVATSILIAAQMERLVQYTVPDLWQLWQTSCGTEHLVD
jgi:hypothetical protein